MHAAAPRGGNIFLYGFFMPFFFSLLSISFPNIFLFCRHLWFRKHVELDDKMTRKSQFCRDIKSASLQAMMKKKAEMLEKYLQVLRSQTAIFCQRGSRRATATFMAFDLKYNPRISASMFRKTV